MAGHGSSVPFKTHWEDMLKRRFGKQTKPYMIVPFSEILLNTLYRGTDIGYIPRRIDSEGLTVPIYETSNWEKDITGCYWCGDKSTDVQGICCGSECIFYFHEWCVERAGMFNKQQRFCKLPGCESVSYQSKYECCSVAHQEKYMHDFLSFHDGNKLKKQLSLGPSWYDNITRKSDSSHDQVQTSSSTIQPDFSKAKMRLAEELSTALLFYTDVGPIPRSYRLSGDSSSQYSAHANWNRKIEGCYLCKQRTSDNEYLCSERCYMIFHEWCRLKVYKHVKENYCRQPGCKHKSRPNGTTCSDTHSELLRISYDKYNLTFSEFRLLEAQGPYWYDNLEISNSTVTSGPSKTGVSFKATSAPTYDPAETDYPKIPNVPTSDPSKTESPKGPGAPTSVHSKTESPRDFYIFSHTLTEWMYEKSDIGPIPRSLLAKFPHIHSFNKHSFPNNWDTDIPMCYWCCTRDHNVHSITCSDKCFFLFNEWCLKKYNNKSHKKLCKYPSCNRDITFLGDFCWKESHGSLYEQKYSTKYFYLLKGTEYWLGPKWYWDGKYCDISHKDDFGKAFAQYVDQESLSKKVLQDGPSQHNSKSLDHQPTINLPESKPNTKIFPNKRSNTSEHLQNKFPGEIKVSENPDKYIPIEFRDYLIFQTDIGIIPRGNPSEQQLASPYSLYPNWKKEIHGCYCCGDKLSASTGNSCICSYSCYLIFYEWCRRKIKSSTGFTLCKFPGCMKPVITGSDYCNNEHAQMIQKEYARLKRLENTAEKQKLIGRNPGWYIPHHSSPNFVFALKLTHFLYHRTDVGPIPREIFPLMSPPPHKNIDSNWNAEIPECYWCCTHPKKNSVACSNKCLFLFNEWLHRKYTKLSRRKLCKYFGCESYSSLNSQCCTQTHSLKYDKLKEFCPLLKSTEFTLGPKWYDDVITTHIDFYNSDEPFYEFTNFYNCEKLFVDLISWTTSEHAFQGNKFVGTPLMTCVSSLDTPRKAFEFARIPTVQRWIRPDWHSIKTQVMLNVLRHKFVQNPDLADILNRTGGKRIFEHTRNDKFWGDGGDRRGANKLGELLMKVRSELRMSTPYFPNTLNHFPNPDKVDVPPNQNPTPSYSSSSKPEDVNSGADSQDKSKRGNILPNQSSPSSHLDNSKTN